MKSASFSPVRIARTARPAGDSVVLVVAAAIFIAQQLAISDLSPHGAPGGFRQVLFFSSTLALAALAVWFRRFWGAWLVALGILMNLGPMAMHKGSMPIDYGIIERSGAFPEVTRNDIGKQTNHGKDVVLEREDIHLFWLSDRYVVDVPSYGTNIYSLGDFVLLAGVGGVVVQAAGMGVRGFLGRGEGTPAPSTVPPNG